MPSVKDTLSDLMSIKGAVGCCLVDARSGLPVGIQGGGDLDLVSAAAWQTEALRCGGAERTDGGDAEPIEEIVVTVGSHYHLVRAVETGVASELFFYLVLDRKGSNLAMARVRLGDAAQKVQLE